MVKRALLAATVATSLLWSGPARGGDEPDDDEEEPRKANPCLVLDQPGAERALAELRLAVGNRRELASVRLRGLEKVDEKRLLEIIGGPAPAPLSVATAAALQARLMETGLFERAVPAMQGEALELTLVENPSVSAVEIRGLKDLPSDELLAALLRTPAHARWMSRWDDDDDDGWRRRRAKKRKKRRAADAKPCAEPVAPREWLARAKGAGVEPGIVWRGLRPALERAANRLRDEGLLLSGFRGELTDEGALHLEVDEGKLEALDLAGVHPALRREVAAEMALAPGTTFSVPALRSAVERVRRRWPFLRPNGALRALPDGGRVVVDETDDGFRFHTVSPEPEPRREPVREGSFFDDDVSEWSPRLWRRVLSRRLRAFEIDGKTVRIHFRSDGTALGFDPVELVRHTQVTGFAPGLFASMRFWDPADRGHVVLDGLFQINTKRSGRVVPLESDVWERAGASERVDWLFGARLQIPSLQIAELGAQIHALTDTPDRFRIGRIDSYLYSFLAARPESEYFRRTGLTAFATLHLGERLTLGAEWRVDRYDTLDGLRVPTVFNRDEAYFNAPVRDGRYGSIVGRLEWSSDPIAPHRLGNPWRATDTSLLPRDFDEPGLRALFTVEVARPGLGGDADAKFTRFVGDGELVMEAGWRRLLRLRLRAVGGKDLPPQKQEGLGGWTALRGYGFKEFRGDASVLATAQLEGRHFGAFVDAGAVKRAEPLGWTDPSLGLGGLFRIEDVRFEAAWRTDRQARLVPEMRLLFARVF